MNGLKYLSDGGHTLVILGCRDKKVDAPGPAIEVYYPSGAVASVKTAIRDNDYNKDVDTYFISGKYGLIPGGKVIDDYDQELQEDEIPKLVQEIGDFLKFSDYEVLYSFVDGFYKHAVNEVAYRKHTWWDIETAMLQPCGRTKSFDGSDIVSSIVRKDVDINSASEVDW